MCPSLPPKTPFHTKVSGPVSAASVSPKISILLPTHNRNDVLACAISSVLSQTFEDFELLIMGDGSPPSTAEIVESFKDSRIRWFWYPKGEGAGYSNRNAVLRQARAEIISYMTHDDLWLPDHLELCLNEFEDLSIDLVYSRPLWVSSEGVIFPIAFNLETPYFLEAFLSGSANAIASTTVLHRQNCFNRCGYWDETLRRNGDWDLWQRIARLRAGNIRQLNEYTALHFHAEWKEPADIPTQYDFWKARYGALGEDLPTELVLPLPNDRPEQHIFWHLISQSPQSYSALLRRNLSRVIDLQLHHMSCIK